MSSNNLPAGAFITTLNGKRCTAIPKASANNNGGQQAVATTADAKIQGFTVVETAAAASTTSILPPPILIDKNTLIVPAQQVSNNNANSNNANLLPPADVGADSSSAAIVAATSADDQQVAPATAAVVAQISTTPSPPPLASPLPGDGAVGSTALPSQPLQTSGTDAAETLLAPTLAAGAPPTPAAPFAQSEITDSPTAQAAGDAGQALFTTIGTAPGEGVSTTPADLGITAVPQPSGGPNSETVAVAGGVVGGIAIMALVGFLLWFWRKRAMRRRRSTLLTPLGAETGGNRFGRGGDISRGQLDEKGAYIIDRGSLGPTPRAEKLRAGLAYRFQALQGRMSRFMGSGGAAVGGFSRSGGSSGAPSVNLNRGNSQFMDPLPTHSRNSSGNTSGGGGVGMGMGGGGGGAGGGGGGAGARNSGPRNVGGGLGLRGTEEPTIRDRLVDWWGGVAGSVGGVFGRAKGVAPWRNRGSADSDDLFGPRETPNLTLARGFGGGSPPMASVKNNNNNNPAKRAPPAANAKPGQPDFLTLLGMDDGQLDREAARRRNERSGNGGGGGGGRGPTGKKGSTDHFLGGLGLGLSFDDPFSDSNAIGGGRAGDHDSAKPSPLVVSRGDNPFSDRNAIGGRPPAAAVLKPSTYVADVRRSRGRSVDDKAPPGAAMQPGRAASVRPGSGPFAGGPPRAGGAIANGRAAAQAAMLERESVASVDSFATRRNKFRSDPFDLERPELLASRSAKVTSSNLSTAGSSQPRESVGTGLSGVRRPGPARQRGDSFSSKYSSGVSLGDWSDPGPDVGPAATRWGSGSSGSRQGESPTTPWRPSAGGGGADQQRREAGRGAGGGGGGGGPPKRSLSGGSDGVGKAL